MTELSLSLPPGCTIRKATAEDIWQIRKLVLMSLLDPTQLSWQQFWVVEYQDHVVACGQLRNFSEAQELGSLVVSPAWRNRGLATFLTQHLIKQATRPLYLECLGHKRKQFFTRFGFVPLSWQELPPPIQKKFSLAHLGKTLIRLPAEFMHYENQD